MNINNMFIIAQSRALPDIISGPEVRQIFKIRIVGKPNDDDANRHAAICYYILELAKSEFDAVLWDS